MDEEEFERRVQGLIWAIIRSGAPMERMTELLKNVPRPELWPAIWLELLRVGEDRGRGGGGS